MPKIKSNRGAAKRFRIKKSGKVKAAKPRRRHLLEWKSPKSRRQRRGVAHLVGCDGVMVKRLLPYG